MPPKKPALTSSSASAWSGSPSRTAARPATAAWRSARSRRRSPGSPGGSSCGPTPGRAAQTRASSAAIAPTGSAAEAPTGDRQARHQHDDDPDQPTATVLNRKARTCSPRTSWRTPRPAAARCSRRRRSGNGRRPSAVKPSAMPAVRPARARRGSSYRVSRPWRRFTEQASQTRTPQWRTASGRTPLAGGTCGADA